MNLNITKAQASALVSLLGACGGNDDLDDVYNALRDNGYLPVREVTFEVNEEQADFGGPDFNIVVL